MFRDLLRAPVSRDREAVVAIPKYVPRPDCCFGSRDDKSSVGAILVEFVQSFCTFPYPRQGPEHGPVGEKSMYRVLVDDNFDFMDEDDRWELGTFATAEGAVAACRALVDKNLARHFVPGMAAAQLYDLYVAEGDDPFIVAGPGEASVKFSAWEYAQERAEQICSAQRESL
jgi:hypothetical protein